MAIRFSLIFTLIIFFGSGGVVAAESQSDKPGIIYHKSLPLKVREEIRVIDDHTVEVSMGVDNSGVSASIINALRSIPLVQGSRMPEEARVRKNLIYRQRNGEYTWDQAGKDPVRLTSEDIRKNGNIAVSIPKTSGQATLQPETKASPTSSSSSPKEKSRKLSSSETQPQRDTDIKGFRSARFGMTEAMVRDAIMKDFGINQKLIQKKNNVLEKTDTLVITVPDLLPGHGPTGVIYIFGYKSRLLNQVNLFWGKPFNSAPKAQEIMGAAKNLQRILAAKGFSKDTVKINIPLSKDLLLVFKGTDNEGSMVEMILSRPSNSKEGEAEQVDKENFSLRLSYIENPANPDIFRSTVQPGDF